jgi:GNAT superfamily N-acetyltransferase
VTALTVRPMTAAEQAAYRDKVAEAYVRHRVEFGGEDDTAAAGHARDSMERLWPDGRPADGQHLYAAEVDGDVVGALWLSETTPDGTEGNGWIYDVEIEDEHRGKGYGRDLICAAEDLAREFGCTTLGLNVFGGNEVAISLYQSLGFRPSSLQMSKPLAVS